MNDLAEFPAFGRIAQDVDKLDAWRQRQVCAFFAAHYSMNLQPSTTKIAATFSPNNRAGFAAIDAGTEELNLLTAAQREQAITVFAARC